MKSPFEVRYTDAAREDLLSLFDFLLERARTIEDFDAALAAIEALRNAVQIHLSRTPFNLNPAVGRGRGADEAGLQARRECPPDCLSGGCEQQRQRP